MIKRTFKIAIGKHTVKQIIRSFSEHYGLVYFGSVSQHDDEHQIIRGMTVSHTHSDEHYSVGSYESYDVSFVKRNDTVKTPTGKMRSHSWLIMQFDLHTNRDLPHVFIGLHSHSESFYRQLFTKYANLRQLQLSSLHTHSPDFLTQYRVYGLPADHLEVEHLLTPQLDAAFLNHFKSLAIEIHEGSLYVYSEHPVSKQLLEAMIKNGTWLAGHIDFTLS